MGSTEGAAGIPTRETLVFLDAHLGPGPRRVLEVGCGAGEVAARLAARGHDVLALDARAEALERARERGLDARLVRVPDEPLPGAGFDAIFVGRVLHHIAELGRVLDVFRDALLPTGLLVIEDYAWERVERPTAAWVQSLLADVAARGGRPQEDWDLAGDPLAAWLANTGEEGLHTSQAMADALAQRFELAHVEPAPYAYRWCARYLPEDVEACEAALAAERTAILIGAIEPIGWRAVARRR